MYNYSWFEWLAFFYFYCFFGWCFESIMVSIREKRFVNRGFMRGPFLPLYGSGAIMMLVVSRPFQHNIVLTYIAGCIGATCLEFITGVLMETLFKVRYWDYSHIRFNIQGKVCLYATLAWGGLTILMTRFLHHFVEDSVFLWNDSILLIGVEIITVLLILDFLLSFKAALELRDILINTDNIKMEFEHLQKRLDVFMAVVEDVKDGYVEEFSKKISETIEQIRENAEQKKQASVYYLAEFEKSIESQIAKIKHFANRNSEEYQKEISSLDESFQEQAAKRARLKGIKDFYRRRMLIENPNMVSKKFKSTLDELKRVALERKTDKENDKEKNKKDKKNEK